MADRAAPTANARAREREAGPRPPVTVVVPTYNRSRWLRQTLDSILDQSFTHFVVLVSDNASDDDTHNVIKRYIEADARVEYIRQPENIGWLRNFNAALATVTTEFVTIVNDDDLLRPGALERAMTALASAPEVGLLHTALDVIGPDNRVVATDTNWTNRLKSDTYESGQQFIRRSMRYFSRVCPPSAVMRTSALPPVPYDPVDGPNSDVTLHLSIALAWDVLFLAASGVAWRTHDDQDSSDMTWIAPDGVQALQLDAIWHIRDVKHRFIRDHSDRLRRRWFLRWQVVRFVDYELAVRCRARASDGRRAVFAEIARSIRRSPTILVEPLFWRTAIRTTLGPELVRRLRRRTSAAE